MTYSPVCAHMCINAFMELIEHQPLKFLKTGKFKCTHSAQRLQPSTRLALHMKTITLSDFPPRADQFRSCSGPVQRDHGTHLANHLSRSGSCSETLHENHMAHIL